MSEVKINFFRGYPSSRLLPQESIIKATSELLRQDSREYDESEEDRHPLSYGTNKGSLWVRCTISESINKYFSPSFPTKAEFVNLTNGSSYGIMNILQQTTLAHTGYTRQAFLVTPTYFLINETFIDAGFGGKMTAVEETVDGEIDVDFLSSKLVEFDATHEYDNDDSSDLSLINTPGNTSTKKVYRYVLYIVPTYSNPTGSSYSIEVRKKLINLARKHDVLIISDDVYDLLVYDQPLDTIPNTIPRLTHLDRDTCGLDAHTYGNTISNVSFSKTIAPGLRCGYQESVNALLVDQLSHSGANVSGGTPSQLNSMIVGTLIKSGEAERILERLRAVYAERCEALYIAINEHLPAGTYYKKQHGGYFSWCTLPKIYNNKAICAEMEQEHGVLLANGSRFEVIGDERNWGATSVRLSISFLEVSDIINGVEIWGRVCRKQGYSSE